MTPDFVILVKQMRDAQKSYFATRKQTSLFQSKDLEKQVDTLIDKYQKEF
jgi:hypothetical protein